MNFARDVDLPGYCQPMEWTPHLFSIMAKVTRKSKTKSTVELLELLFPSLNIEATSDTDKYEYSNSSLNANIFSHFLKSFL